MFFGPVSSKRQNHLCDSYPLVQRLINSVAYQNGTKLAESLPCGISTDIAQPTDPPGRHPTPPTNTVACRCVPFFDTNRIVKRGMSPWSSAPLHLSSWPLKLQPRTGRHREVAPQSDAATLPSRAGLFPRVVKPSDAHRHRDQEQPRPDRYGHSDDAGAGQHRCGVHRFRRHLGASGSMQILGLKSITKVPGRGAQSQPIARWRCVTS